MYNKTDYDSLEIKLKQVESNFFNLADNYSNLILMVENDRVVFVNKVIQNILGYYSHEIISQTFTLSNIIIPAQIETLHQVFRDCKQDRNYVDLLIGLIHKNGNIVNIKINVIIPQESNSLSFICIFSEPILIKSDQEIRLVNAEKLVKTLNSVVEALASTMHIRDRYTDQHQRSVCKIACAIATEMNLPDETIEGIRLGATIHDIGKLYIPQDILSKPPPLEENEISIIHMHPKAGYDILKKIDFPWPIPEIALSHHERMDGSGYPNKALGNKILLESRIVAVADVIDAMSSHRPYRPALGLDKSLVEIIRGRDTLFDANVVDACKRLFYDKAYKLDDQF